MAVSKIVIDRSKCDGCGLCVEACHEGALALVGGKAEMVREDYCDGLGDCLPACPKGAITFLDAEEPAPVPVLVSECACSSSNTLTPIHDGSGLSELRQWPIKIRLVSETSPILNGADLLLIADCTAFAYSGIHKDFIRGRKIVTCCPKFDTGHIEKLTNILSKNGIKSLTVVRMTVPCCSLDRVADNALRASGKSMPVKVVTIDQRGSVKTESR